MHERDIMSTRKRILPAFVFMIVLSVVMFLLLSYLKEAFADNKYIFDFDELMKGCAEGSFKWRVLWFLYDLAEGPFMCVLPAGILMVIGAYLSAYLERKGSRFKGTGTDGTGYLFTSMSLCGFLTIILGELIFGFWFDDGFLPTFTSFIMTQLFIITYKANDIKRALTVTVVVTLIHTPIAFLVINYIATANNLPMFSGFAMSGLITIPAISETLRRLKWMEIINEPPEIKEVTISDNMFFINRVFGDVMQTILWGSSISCIFMYVGSVFSMILNPDHQAGQMEIVMPMQILTGSVAVFVWWDSWKQNGWEYTINAILFTSAVSIMYPPNLIVLLLSIAIGVFGVVPLLRRMLQWKKITDRWPAVWLVFLSNLTFLIPWCLIIKFVLAI